MDHLIDRARRDAAIEPWQAEALQLLEEHHLAAYAPDAGVRDRFALGLADAVARLPDTEACLLEGSRLTDLASFSVALGTLVGIRESQPSIEGERGVLQAMRTRTPAGRERALKRRYIIWRDADAMLKADHRLFGRLVDAMAGVAAECEYTGEDLLLLVRVVFVGSPALDGYAEDPEGQFRAWLREGQEEPLWRLVTGVEAPPILRYRIDRVPTLHGAG